MHHDIHTTATALEGSLIALRREIHAHPELAGHETRTAALVATRLRAAGLHVTTGIGGHGVLAVLDGARPGRTIAYRADMDAVPPGAHLCGHDLHTTVGVGVAEVLAALRHRLAGRYAFLFQPAEEDLTGARAMLDDGVLDLAAPDEIHALHCGPMPTGTITVTPGNGLPGLDHATITTATPDEATELAADIAALGTVTPPQTPEELARLIEDLATPNGPLATYVYMRTTAEGTTVRAHYRTWPEERARTVREDVTALADGAPVAFPDAPFPALVCAAPDALELAAHLRGTGVRVDVAHAAIPFSGEDHALFARRLPGTYSYLGVRRPGAASATGFPHHPAFDPDESAIGVGVRAMAGWLAARAEVS